MEKREALFMNPADNNDNNLGTAPANGGGAPVDTSAATPLAPISSTADPAAPTASVPTMPDFSAPAPAPAPEPVAAMPNIPTAPAPAPTPEPVAAMPNIPAAPVAPVPPALEPLPLTAPTDSLAPAAPTPADPLAASPLPPAPAPVTPDPLAPAPAAEPMDSQAMLEQAFNNPYGLGAAAPAQPPIPPAAEPTTASTEGNPIAGTDFTNDPSVAPAAERPEEDFSQNPITPATPVPGSIGSSTSYTDYQAQEQVKAQREAAKQQAVAPAAGGKKPMSKTTIILLAVIGVVAVVGGIVAVVLLMNSNNTPQPTTPQTSFQEEEEEQDEDAVLTCRYIADADALQSVGDAVSWDEEFIVEYEAGEITDISDIATVTYSSATAARNGLNIFRDRYNQLLVNAGLTEDPFDTTYRRVDEKLTVSHPATGNKLTARNGSVLGFKTGDDGELDTSLDSIMKAKENAGYQCENSNDDTTIDEDSDSDADGTQIITN